MTQQEGFPDKPQLKLPFCLWQAAKEPLALGLGHLFLLYPWGSQGCFSHSFPLTLPGLGLFKTCFLWGTTTLAEPCAKIGLSEADRSDTAPATPHRCPAGPTASTSPTTSHTAVTVTMINFFHSWERTKIISDDPPSDFSKLSGFAQQPYVLPLRCSFIVGLSQFQKSSLSYTRKRDHK